RQGILSMAAFLAVAPMTAGDTSPTKRGKFIRNRLLCQVIPPPPPSVNVDDVNNKASGACKIDRYASHRQLTSCNLCHSQMDPMGFGLENSDLLGRFRTTEPNAPQCAIAGDGELANVGKFHGPKQLADLLVQSHSVEPCAARQLYRFVIGRTETGDDEPAI